MKRVTVDFTTAVEQALLAGKQVFYAQIVEVPDSIQKLRELGNTEGVSFFIDMEEIEEPQPMPVEMVPEPEEKEEEIEMPSEESMKDLYRTLVEMEEKQEQQEQQEQKKPGRKKMLDNGKIVELKKQGLSNHDIAEKLGCNYATVCKILKKEGF